MASEPLVSEKPTVFITGASSGIGRAIAISLAETGEYKLALTARREKELVKTVNACKEVNGEIETLILPCDATDESKFKEIIEVVGNNFGPLCCCIQNAGLYVQTLIDSKEGKSISEINQCLDLNLKSVIHGCTYCVPFIKETKQKYGNDVSCAIILIASDSSTIRATGAREGIYCASKYGLLGFAECLYHEMRDYGIKVSSIMPGWVNTPFTHRFNDDKNNSQYVDLKKCLQPQDIAHAVDYVLNSPITCVPLQVLLLPQFHEMKSKL